MKKDTQKREVPSGNGADRSAWGRERLRQTNIYYQEALEEQLTELKREAQGWLKGAAIVGGVIFVGYSIYKLFMETDEEPEEIDDDKKKTLPAHHRSESPIVRMVKESIALFLIGIAKQKIQEFLQSLEIDHEIGDTPSSE